MLKRTRPPRIDNIYSSDRLAHSGNRLAVWLLIPILFIKPAIGPTSRSQANLWRRARTTFA